MHRAKLRIDTPISTHFPVVGVFATSERFFPFCLLQRPRLHQSVFDFSLLGVAYPQDELSKMHPAMPCGTSATARGVLAVLSAGTSLDMRGLQFGATTIA